MFDVITFIVVVGLCSTFVLDGWARLMERFAGLPATDWGLVGRWVSGLANGKLVLDTTNSAPAGRVEKMIGWTFHYTVGLGYAALLPAFWGLRIIINPSLAPFIVIGLLASTVAGLVIFMPAMGAGIFGSRLSNQGRKILFLIIAHGVFAVTQLGSALLLSAFI